MNNKKLITALTNKMINFYGNDPMRIQHFIKVNAFACLIGEQEELSQEEQFILSAASLVHDIGIHEAEKRYGSSAGKYQEELGPDIARNMLSKLGFEERIIDRVCYLVGHHHTYKNIDGLDYQILIEADFIVNVYEDDLSHEAAVCAYNSIFKTVTGKRIFADMYKGI